MTLALFVAILASGFGVAFVHTLIPVHWLPFAVTGRARGWSLRRTLTVNAIGGIGHVLVTAALGAVVLVLGLGLDRWLEGVLPWIVVAVLAILGAWFLYRQFAGGGHVHGRRPRRGGRRSDRLAMLALIVMLMLSPCEVFLPIYLAGGPAGWAGFVWLTLVLALATMSCMLLLTALAWRGMGTRASGYVVRWQSGIVGVVLLLLAALMALWHP